MLTAKWPPFCPKYTYPSGYDIHTFHTNGNTFDLTFDKIPQIQFCFLDYKNFTSESSTDAFNFEPTNLDLSSTDHLRFRVRGDREALMILNSQSVNNGVEPRFFVAIATGSAENVTIASETDIGSVLLEDPVIAADVYSEFWIKWTPSEVGDAP